MSNREPVAEEREQDQADLIDALAGAATVALVVLDALNFTGPVRVLLALVFAFFVPGRATVSNWPRMANWSGIGMSVVLSLGFVALLATIMLWARYWHPLGLFSLEAILSLIGLGVAIIRRRRGQYDTTA
jgi:uncharacterized membrane protein